MFVGRNKELREIEDAMQAVREGAGKFVIIEGPAGMGKTALVNRALSGATDFKLFRASARVETSTIPYSIFLKALNMKSINDIHSKHTDNVARALAQELKNRSRALLFINEKRAIMSEKLFRELGGGLHVSSTSTADIYLTEMDIENGYDPYELESRVLDRINEYMRFSKKPVILIDGMNYLLSTVGPEKVTIVLRDLVQNLKKGILICTGDLEAVDDNSAQKIISIFENVYHFGDSGYREESTLNFTTLPYRSGKVFSDSSGDYIVSENSSLRPSMLRFKLLETVIDSLKSGNISINCLRTLIDYNSLKEVYVWLKYVRDIAKVFGHHVYVYSGELTADEQKFLDNLVDRYINPVQGDYISYEFYEATIKYLEHLATAKPVCVVLEDIQWADMNTVKLLDYIARNMPTGVLFIVTYRGEDVAFTQKSRILSDIREYDSTVFLRLAPLKKEEFMQFISTDTKNADDLYRRSGGNPLLIKEMLKYNSSHSNFVPDTIKESIEHQILQTDDSTLMALRQVAVMGSEVPVNEVTEIFGSELVSALKNATDFVEITDKIQFRSTVAWEYVYFSTAPDIKAQIHKKLGDYFASRSVFMAAYHYYRARDKKAIEFLTDAAQKAKDMYALDNAMSLYRQALEICRKYGDVTREGIILEKLGDVEELTGYYQDAITHYTQALEKTDNYEIQLKLSQSYIAAGEYDRAKEFIEEIMRSEDITLQNKVKDHLGTILLRTGHIEEAEKYYQEYLEFVESSGNTEELSKAYLHMATLKFHQSQYKESLEFAKRAMENAEENGDYQQIIAVYNLLGVIYDVIGKPQQALEKYSMVKQLAEKAGDLKGMALAYNNMGILYYTLGNLKMVKNHLEQALRLHQKMGDKRSLALSYYNLSGVYADLGDFQKAQEYAERARNLYQEMGNVYYLAFTDVWIGIYNMRMMLYKEALEHIDNALKIGTREKYPKLNFMATIAKARVYLKMGNYAEALNILNREPEFIESMKGDVDAYPEFLLVLYEALIKAGEFQRAAEVGTEMEELLKWVQDRYVLGAYLVLRAIYKTKTGEDGTEDFKIGISHIKKQGYIAAYAEMQYEYGKALLSSGNSRGREHLKIAKNLFENMNLENMVKEIINLCDECEKGI